jgi:hypothetical protein
MGVRRRSWLLSALAALVVAQVAPASAQGAAGGETTAGSPDALAPDPTAQARALFAEGVAHTQAHEWEPAADAFTRALALRPAPAIRYNLAATLVELGRYREASSRLAELVPDELPANLAPLVDALGARIRREAGRLSVRRAADLGDATVTLDDEALDERELTRQIPVAAGSHSVAAIRDGAAVATASVSVEAGERVHVLLALTGADGRGEPEEPPPPTDMTQEWGFWVAVGVGALVFVAVAVVVGISTADTGGTEPIEGNFSPGVITWP